jgi:hypothetical protein
VKQIKAVGIGAKPAEHGRAFGGEAQCDGDQEKAADAASSAMKNAPASSRGCARRRPQWQSAGAAAAVIRAAPGARSYRPEGTGFSLDCAVDRWLHGRSLNHRIVG